MYRRPLESECNAFYHGYIAKTVGNSPQELIFNHAAAIISALSDIPESRSGYAYAPGKWTIAQMVQHMIDTERIFVYRLLWIIRGGSQPLPGFDENAFAAAAPAQNRSFQQLIQEFDTLRKSTDHMMAGLSPEDLNQEGVASGHPVTANAICYMIYGHALHHLQVLREKYG